MATGKKDANLGKQLAFFRRKMNWPLKTLASGIGISIQQLQRYEKGINRISAITLYEIAKKFKIDVGYFFENIENEDDRIDSDFYGILLIEDSDNDDFLLRNALSDFPKRLDISTIKDGHKALKYLHALKPGKNKEEDPCLIRPDLILLDLHLPTLRGLDILKDIKQRPYLRDIPVIVLSSSSNPADRAAAYASQASGFIRKSFSYEEFKSQLCGTMHYWTTVVDLPRVYER